MSRVFNPVYSSTSDGSDVTLCRILEAASQLAAGVNGGLLPHKKISAASINATVVKASAGKIYNLVAINTLNQTHYLRLYDLATTPNPSTDVEDYIVPLHAGQTVGLTLGTAPFYFHNGISYVMTSGATGVGAVSAGDIILNLTWA
jgi:hypothetical protein